MTDKELYEQDKANRINADMPEISFEEFLMQRIGEVAIQKLEEVLNETL